MVIRLASSDSNPDAFLCKVNEDQANTFFLFLQVLYIMFNCIPTISSINE